MHTLKLSLPQLTSRQRGAVWRRAACSLSQPQARQQAAAQVYEQEEPPYGAGSAQLYGRVPLACCHNRRLDSRLPHRSMNRKSSPTMRCACHKALEL